MPRQPWSDQHRDEFAGRLLGGLLRVFEAAPKDFLRARAPLRRGRRRVVVSMRIENTLINLDRLLDCHSLACRGAVGVARRRQTAKLH